MDVEALQLIHCILFHNLLFWQ